MSESPHLTWTRRSQPPCLRRSLCNLVSSDQRGAHRCRRLKRMSPDADGILVMNPALIEARIMIVDDQPANVLLVRRILGQAGFTHVRGYKDPRVALEDCPTWNPDLI